jgi:hypothetical protein
MSDEVMGDEVYQPDGSEVQDDEGVLEPADTLIDRGLDQALDEGYSPPERPWAVERFGLTASEQRRGETLEQRLAEELPEVAAPEGDDIGDVPGDNGEPRDAEVGDARAGRLVGLDGGFPPGADDVFGWDVGIAGGAASAEEAAVHVIPDPEEYNLETR